MFGKEVKLALCCFYYFFAVLFRITTMGGDGDGNVEEEKDHACLKKQNSYYIFL